MADFIDRFIDRIFDYRMKKKLETDPELAKMIEDRDKALEEGFQRVEDYIKRTGFGVEKKKKNIKKQRKIREVINEK